jgi:hypothetical protein
MEKMFLSLPCRPLLDRSFAPLHTPPWSEEILFFQRFRTDKVC